MSAAAARCDVTGGRRLRPQRDSIWAVFTSYTSLARCFDTAYYGAARPYLPEAQTPATHHHCSLP